LIRHAHPAAGWAEETNPGLDGLGDSQAEAAAREFACKQRPLPIYTSPLRRCLETARPLESMWRRAAAVLEPVAELPSPRLDMKERYRWLRQAMQGTWSDLQARAPPGSPDYLAWRESLLGALRALPQDSVVFTHFIAINAAVAAAQGRDEVVCFRPDHASITCLDARDGRFQVLQLGREADTAVGI